MFDMRKWTPKLITILAFGLFLMFGLYVRDVKNDIENESRMLGALIYDFLRAYDTTGDPGARIYSCIGSRKTKLYYTFESECAGDIPSAYLTGFDTWEDAAEAGYGRCKVCQL